MRGSSIDRAEHPEGARRRPCDQGYGFGSRVAFVCTHWVVPWASNCMSSSSNPGHHCGFPTAAPVDHGVRCQPALVDQLPDDGAYVVSLGRNLTGADSCSEALQLKPAVITPEIANQPVREAQPLHGYGVFSFRPGSTFKEKAAADSSDIRLVGSVQRSPCVLQGYARGIESPTA